MKRCKSWILWQKQPLRYVTFKICSLSKQLKLRNRCKISLLILKAHSRVLDNFWQLKNPLKWWKMFITLYEKLFSFLRYLHFCLDFLVMKKKTGFISRLSLIPKFMTSQTGQQIITIYILPNISRSKDKKAMKFGQRKKYFSSKSCRKWGRETSCKPLFIF